MTNRCKNITLPQTSFAGGKNVTIEKIIRTCILLCGRLEYYYAAPKTRVTGTIIEMTPFMHHWFCQIHWNHWISVLLKNQNIAKNWVQKLILNKPVKHFNLPSPAALVGILLSAQITILLLTSMPRHKKNKKKFYMEHIIHKQNVLWYSRTACERDRGRYGERDWDNGKQRILVLSRSVRTFPHGTTRSIWSLCHSRSPAVWLSHYTEYIAHKLRYICALSMRGPLC